MTFGLMEVFIKKKKNLFTAEIAGVIISVIIVVDMLLSVDLERLP